MKYGSEKPDERRRSGRLKPPPNYFARGVQMRLMMLVFSFMLVIVLMGEARKPQNWRWLFGREMGAGQSPLTADEITNEEIDTRLRPAPGDNATVGPVVSGQDEPQDQTAPPEFDSADSTTSSDEALHAALLDGWSQRLENLGDDGRAALYQALKSARDDARLDDNETAALALLLSQLDSEWRQYFEDSFLAAAQTQTGLTDEQRKIWLDVLDQMQHHWSQQWRPALEGLLEDRGLIVEQQQSLAELQTLFDEIEIRFVRDDTVARNVERHAWFRLLEKLQTAGDEELQSESLGRVGYVQLYKTPGDYRGEAVTVRGTARLAYHVQAPSNMMGIDGYYIFWLKPAGGPDSPIVVYSLDLPPGFPQVKDRDLDKTTTELNEDVEFTGYFFKRWAYRAKDGTRLAPLVLARSPQWTAPVIAPADSELPSAAWMVVAVCGAMAVGILIAIAAYFRSNWISASRLHRDRGLSPQSLADADRGADVGQTLRRLAEHQRNEPGEHAEPS